MILALPNLDKINDFFGIGSLMAVAITVALTLDLSINISFNPTRSIIADVTPDGQPRTKGFTWMQSTSNLFGSLAYLTGALLGNYTLIYAGVAVVFLFSIGPLFFIREPRALTETNKQVATRTQWGELFKLYFAHSFYWLGIQTMFIYIIAFIEQKIHPETAIQTGQIIGWSFFILNAVGFIWPAFLLEPLSKKIGRVPTQAICVASMSLGYFGIVLWAHNAILLYILMGVLTFGWAAVVSLPFAIMSEMVNKARMGFFMGIFNLSVVLPQLVASFVIGSIVMRSANKNIIFIISGVSLAVSALLWLTVREKKKTGS